MDGLAARMWSFPARAPWSLSGGQLFRMSMTVPPERLAQLRRRRDEIRDQAARRVASGATGLQIAATIAAKTDEFLVALMRDALREIPDQLQTLLLQSTAVVAIGGSGRQDCAPYSDADILFLSSRGAPDAFAACVAQVVRDSWDAGLKLGHSVRNLNDTTRMARQDTHFATSLVDLRCLWGSESLVEELQRRFQREVISSHARRFIDDCIASRLHERAEHGEAVLQLEPDIKRSFGGLRDLHLIRWVGRARFGASDLDSLKEKGALSPDDTRRLIYAWDYLTSIRVNLHLHAGKPHDILTRDDQLRIAEERAIAGTAGQRPVERFMQEYFHHSQAIADISSRFIARHRQHPMLRQAVRFVMSYQVENRYQISPEVIDVLPRHLEEVCGSLEELLRLYELAIEHGVLPSPLLMDAIRERTKLMQDAPLSARTGQTFLSILRRSTGLAGILRSMYDTGVLELVLPAMRHTRCLLQFNQYHAYTVDEHTLRAIAAATAFEKEAGSLGRAYREIQHKELLHLALLLHDAGKGYEEDHSEVGARLAVEAAQRLGLPDHQRDLLVLLVHRHLLMATLAFRRDTADPEILLNFSHEVGSPDALKLLYVLTAADITAVGPGVWNDWKGELLASLYDRSMTWLSGKGQMFQESDRLSQVIEEVLPDALASGLIEREAVTRLQLSPSHYLLSTTPERIAQDLKIIQDRSPEDITIQARYDEETATIEYRVITSESVGAGLFHKITAVLSAKRMEILSAQICTFSDGVVIDSFRVRDYDHEGAVPAFRIEDVDKWLRKAIRDELDVESLFRSRARFAPNIVKGPVSNLPLRIVIDNETSDRYTVIDVFAHDRPGLLYRITRTLFELDLSVVLAKISTHFDQVVDVFYVTDFRGRRISDSQRLRVIRAVLMQEIQEFELASSESA